MFKKKPHHTEFQLEFYIINAEWLVGKDMEGNGTGPSYDETHPGIDYFCHLCWS